MRFVLAAVAAAIVAAPASAYVTAPLSIDFADGDVYAGGVISGFTGTASIVNGALFVEAGTGGTAEIFFNRVLVEAEHRISFYQFDDFEIKGGTATAFTLHSGSDSKAGALTNDWTHFGDGFFTKYDGKLTANGSFYIDNLSGFTLSYVGVPEPASWALMIAGFGLAGAAVRNRKRAPLPRLS